MGGRPEKIKEQLPPETNELRPVQAALTEPIKEEPFVPRIEPVQASSQPITQSFLSEKVYLIWVYRYISPCLSVTVLRHICDEYLQPCLPLVGVWPTSICSGYYWEKQAWHNQTPHTLPGMNEDSAVISLENKRLFICGCDRMYKTAFVLEDGVMDLKTRMLAWHRAPGLLYHAPTSCVYVFGGVLRKHLGIEFSDVSEKLFLASGLWRELKPMSTGRGMFNPCLHESVIYLCGGRSLAVETYNPRIDVYEAVMPIPLPQIFYIFDSVCISDRGKLTILLAFSVATLGPSGWKMQPLTDPEIEPNMYLSENVASLWSNCTPVVVNHQAYLVDMRQQRCVKVDLVECVVSKHQFTNNKS